MKKLFCIIGMLCFSHLIHAQHLPQTTITDLSTGKKVAFNSTVEQGKVTLISFWATWCIPCKNEIRNIVKVMDTWKQSADFNYITVSIDETRAQGLARSYAINQGWKFPYYIDPNSDLKRSLNFQNVPFTLIIDKAGNVAFTHTGYEEGGEKQIFEKIKELAAK